MKNGNFTNAILRRSVYGLLGSSENSQKPCIGNEAGSYRLSEDVHIVTAAATGPYAVYRAAAKVCAKAEPLTMALQIRFPKSYEEGHVKNAVRTVRGQCEALGTAITALDVCGDDSVAEAVITAVCTGRLFHGNQPVIAPNQDIVVTGTLGTEGMRILGEKYRDKLCERFTQLFYEKAMGSEQELSVVKECRIAWDRGAYIMPMGEGGIFAALWNLSEYGGVGLDVDLKKFPVKQEIIEVCEFLGKNIYELSSFGGLLVTSDRGCDIMNALGENGIAAAVIGKTTASNDKVIHNDDEIRFLDTPKRDEIYN